MYILLFWVVAYSSICAKEEEHHSHVDSSNIKINYEVYNFKNSKKKENGQRYGVEIDHQTKEHHFQFYYEKSDTKTTKIVPKDLEVNKYVFKYKYSFANAQKLSLSYMKIYDNLMNEVDGGNIYGMGYDISYIGLRQYISDYSHFDVYQTDLMVKKEFHFYDMILNGLVIGKYIHLNDKDSNNFSKKAKNNYFTLGIKLHTHYMGYHFGAAAYVGDRIFAVMNDGLVVQHHAMEFKQSYMLTIGHNITDKISSHIRYIHHNAKEVPIDNDNVKVDNITFNIVYRF
jgi:Ni,Fe-hydrogenase III component G